MYCLPARPARPACPAPAAPRRGGARGRAAPPPARARGGPPTPLPPPGRSRWVSRAWARPAWGQPPAASPAARRTCNVQQEGSGWGSECLLLGHVRAARSRPACEPGIGHGTACGAQPGGGLRTPHAEHVSMRRPAPDACPDRLRTCAPPPNSACTTLQPGRALGRQHAAHGRQR